MLNTKKKQKFFLKNISQNSNSPQKKLAQNFTLYSVREYLKEKAKETKIDPILLSSFSVHLRIIMLKEAASKNTSPLKTFKTFVLFFVVFYFCPVRLKYTEKTRSYVHHFTRFLLRLCLYTIFIVELLKHRQIAKL